VSDFAGHYPLVHYAQNIGISTAHLNALCRQLTSRSALELIQERIALEARRNLVYTAMTISTVAEALGFADPAYFTRFFKRHTGMSPKAFRLQAVKLVGEGNTEGVTAREEKATGSMLIGA
jgi:AraC family transcriptional activator of pobA